MENTYLLHILDSESDSARIFCSVLFGEIIHDETNRFPKSHRVITSPVINQIDLKFSTKSGSSYVADAKPHSLIITAKEWLIMRESRLSPSELLALRTLSSIDNSPIKH